MSASVYFETRPAYVGEITTATATVAGSGNISAWRFGGHLYGASGTEVTGAVTVAIADAVNRVLTITIAGQTAAGDYSLDVIRTDDGLGLVVVRGVLEITDPTKR